jgi:acyl carrier protein
MGAVRTFLSEEVVDAETAASIPGDEDLLGRGVLNSLTLTHLVVFLEERFALRVEPFEFELETFRTLEGITRFVESKLDG